MSEKWRHLGPAESFASRVLPPYKELVENTETGEKRTVWVGSNETVGEAIAKGQWADNDRKASSGYESRSDNRPRDRSDYQRQKREKNNQKRSKKPKYYSSGYSGGGSDGGGCGCGLIILAIIMIGTVVSIISNSNNTKNTSAIPKNQPVKQRVRLQDENTYFQERFKVSIENAYIEGSKTVVGLRLINLSEAKSKVLISSGQPISNLGQEQFVTSPFLRDEHGNEYMVEQPAIRGEAENYIFNEDGWGGRSTIKVGLPPNASVSGQMIFPRLRAGSHNVTLTIPGIGGWQTDIVIPNILVVTNNSSEYASDEGNQEQIRTSAEVDPSYVNRAVIINYAGVAEELRSDGSPIGEDTVFRGNGRYDRNRRDYVTYYAKFSDAVPERTRFKAKIFYNGSEDLYMHHCPATTAKGRTGIYSCRPGPYYLAQLSHQGVQV